MPHELATRHSSLILQSDDQPIAHTAAAAARSTDGTRTALALAVCGYRDEASRNRC